MAKVVLSMFMTLDGYFAGQGGEFIPPTWSDEMEAWALEAMQQSGHFLYGRVNFQFNKGFWEAAETDPDSPAASIAYAGDMNAKPKTVFSRTLTGDPGWNATLVHDDLPGAVARLKAANKKDLFLFGGGNLACSFIELDLIDEYRLLVTQSCKAQANDCSNLVQDMSISCLSSHARSIPGRCFCAMNVAGRHDHGIGTLRASVFVLLPESADRFLRERNPVQPCDAVARKSVRPGGTQGALADESLSHAHRRRPLHP
jgi:dihydrofolate reductase